MERQSMDPQLEAEYRAGLVAALQAGARILNDNGSALDAVEKAVTVLEDDPLFNAGRGAVFTASGRNELDASIMDGATLRAGAVAGVTRTRHPISLARAIMEKSPHVMLIGAGADAFAHDYGLEQVDPSFFFTERRWEELVRQLTKEGRPIPVAETREFGTVGTVALDRAGNLAAGTSTGGVRAKLPGRVGDTGIIGAGTYASNTSCAVSGTGAGEFFIRLALAHEICALVQYKNMSLQAAADEVIHSRLKTLQGDGGVIAVAPDGQLVWSFNTPGMFRARLAEGGQSEVAIYGDEP
jgi:beta-aspartyl-peptidase (threonine type)